MLGVRAIPSVYVGTTSIHPPGTARRFAAGRHAAWYTRMNHLPTTLTTWLSRGRESDVHLTGRVERYLRELYDHGLLDRLSPAPRLSVDGGQVVLRLLGAESEDPL
jgi:hypothetical protein